MGQYDCEYNCETIKHYSDLGHLCHPIRQESSLVPLTLTTGTAGRRSQRDAGVSETLCGAPSDSAGAAHPGEASSAPEEAGRSRT